MQIIDIDTRIGVQPEDDRSLDAPTLLAQMDRAGVSEALCTHFAAIRFDVRAGNDELLAICRQEPRLHPVAAINPAPYIGIVEEIRRCAQEGCVGFRFTPGLQGWSLASEPFASALQAVSETGLPLAVELSTSGEATLVGRLTKGLGAPVILANVTYATLGEAIAVLEQDDHLYLEACRLATPGVVELLVEQLGAERLLFGSGAPAWEIVPTLAMVREAEIPDGAKAAILGENARRLYRLGGRGGEA